MPNDGNHFPTANPIWGFNPYSQITDVVSRSYQENTDATPSVVVPSDTVDLALYAVQLDIGVGGDVAILTSGGVQITLPALPAGLTQRLPFRIARILATGTTATNIVAIS